MDCWKLEVGAPPRVLRLVLVLRTSYCVCHAKNRLWNPSSTVHEDVSEDQDTRPRVSSPLLLNSYYDVARLDGLAF